MPVEDPMRRFTGNCVLLICVTAVGSGCGAAATAGSAPSSSGAPGSTSSPTDFLNSIVAAVGSEHFTKISFGHSPDPDVADPAAPWLDVSLVHPTVGAGTEDYWAAVLLEREYNEGAARAGVEPIAGMTIDAPTGYGGTRTDGQVENPQPTHGARLGPDEVRDQVSNAVDSLSHVSLVDISFVGTKSDGPIVRLQTDDAAAFVKSVQNPYFAIFGEANVEGGYVQVADTSGKVVLVGASVPSEGFTAVWVEPDLDWHQYYTPSQP
jgi:hypothetical protein